MASQLEGKLVPHLWYEKGADEAARFYCSIFPDSRVVKVSGLPAETPSGPPGSVVVVEFQLLGQPLVAMTAGPHDPFNDAISLMVLCDDQAEIDRYWDAIEKHGGTPQACGWIKDRWGVRWQITPRRLTAMIGDPDRAKSQRVTEAMLRMVKLDLPVLEAAYEGREPAPSRA